MHLSAFWALQIKTEKCWLAVGWCVGHLRPYGKCIQWCRADRMYLELSATVMLHPAFDPPHTHFSLPPSSSSPAAVPSALVHIFMSLFSVDDEIFSSFAAYHLCCQKERPIGCIVCVCSVCRCWHKAMITCTWPLSSIFYKIVLVLFICKITYLYRHKSHSWNYTCIMFVDYLLWLCGLITGLLDCYTLNLKIVCLLHTF